jgi:hypothetical protein
MSNKNNYLGPQNQIEEIKEPKIKKYIWPVIIGIGKSYEFEVAKMSSQVDATKCFEEKYSKYKNASLVFVYEYWEEDEENFYVYSVYKVIKR